MQTAACLPLVHADAVYAKGLALRNEGLDKVGVKPEDLEKLDGVPLMASLVSLVANLALLIAMSNNSWITATALSAGQPFTAYLSLTSVRALCRAMAPALHRAVSRCSPLGCLVRTATSRHSGDSLSLSLSRARAGARAHTHLTATAIAAPGQVWHSVRPGRGQQVLLRQCGQLLARQAVRRARRRGHLP